MKTFDLSLYLVLDPALCADIGMVETARAAVVGGATIVQLRDKLASTASMIETGRALKAALAGTGVRLIVNDDVETAITIGADGLHIGQEDMDVQTARRLIGPVFATATKPDHKQPIGMAGLSRIVDLCPVPSVAIGGLKAEHAADAFSAGADGIAVVSAICGKPDPQAATAEIAMAIRKARP